MQAYFFLSCFSEEDMAWIIEAGNKKILEEKHKLIKLGAINDNLYIVLEGLLRVSSPDLADIATLHPGEVVGEISIVDDRVSMADVHCISDCTVFILEREKILKKIKEDPKFGCNFYRSMSLFLAHRLRNAQQKDHNSEMSPQSAEDLFEEEMKGQVNPELLKTLLLSGQRFLSLLKKSA